MAIVLIYLVISLITGVLCCFYGKKLYYIITPLLISILLSMYIVGNKGFEIKYVIIIAIVFVATLLLFKFVYKASVFILMALAGAGIGAFITLFIHDGNMFYNYKWIFVAVISILFGIIGVIWADLFVIISTSYTGGVQLSQMLIFIITQVGNIKNFEGNGDLESVSNSISLFIKNDLTQRYGIYYIVATIIFMIIGIIYQKKHNKK